MEITEQTEEGGNGEGPRRAALILSAKQWAAALKDTLLDTPLDPSGNQDLIFKHMDSCCERIGKTLDELMAMEDAK